MQIGKPLREISVEPLQSPVPAAAPDPGPEKPEPVGPTHEQQPEPEHVPVA